MPCQLGSPLYFKNVKCQNNSWEWFISFITFPVGQKFTYTQLVLGFNISMGIVCLHTETALYGLNTACWLTSYYSLVTKSHLWVDLGGHRPTHWGARPSQTECFSPQKGFITDRNTTQFHQLSGWLVSDDPAGKEARCGGLGLAWLHEVCGLFQPWGQLDVLPNSLKRH